MDRLPLAQLPTPLEHADRLSEAWGHDIWIKRDDLTGFGLSGNKVRKLEYHAAAATAAGATTLITCGAVQSNHCRATAMVAARLGFGCILFLRSRNGEPPTSVTGNHLLQRLVGAEVRFITRDQWEDRLELMQEAADQHGHGWVMPAGASDALGVAAFRHAFSELAQQVEPLGDRAVIWHASSSGGTTAGLALGAALARPAFDARVIGASVGESEAELRECVDSLLADESVPDAPYEIDARYVGLGYGLTTEDELAVQVEASRLTGQVWDPTYTGKALYALRQEIAAGSLADPVIFWHTGGGFAAFAHDYGGVLG